MAAVYGRTCVARSAELAIEERITVSALMIRHRPGKEPHGRIDDRERRRLSSAQNEVPEGNFLGGEMIRDALVDVLVVSAQNRELRARRVPKGVRLLEMAAAGREQDDRRRGSERIACLEEGIGLHDH